MKTQYCTSCGAETRKKLCQSCGVKQDKVHNFCKNCGKPLPPKASICVNCKERVKGDSAFWSLLNLVCALVPLIMAYVCINEGQPIYVTVCFVLGFLFCLPRSRKIINACTIGKRGLRAVLKLARILLVAGLIFLGMFLVMEAEAEPEELTVEEAYEEIIYCAEEGYYKDAWRISVSYPEVKEYEDAADYLTYCDALRAYNAGALGYAYENLSAVPEVLDAASYLASLDAEIGRLNGVFVEDNGAGAYLYLVIEDGKTFTEVVSYDDYTADYTYDLSQERCDHIVKGSFTTGEAYYAIGRYNYLGEEITESYIMTIFEEDGEIMMVAPEGAEFKTFNGLYEKIR